MLYTYSSFFVHLISAFRCGTSLLIIGVQNPIHAILLLIMVFFLGTLLLFFISREYFAMLFLIVYVGAIVVLFLFIIMMLELKRINVVVRFRDLFSYQHIILGFCLLEVRFIMSLDFFDIFYFINGISSFFSEPFFFEANGYLD